MKNSELLGHFQNLKSIMEKAISTQKEYPVKFSYALTKNLIDLEKAVEPFNKERDKLLEEYNVKDKDGNPEHKTTGKIEIAQEYIDVWNAKIQELLDIEVAFEPHKVSIENFPDTVEPTCILALGFMIDD